MAAEDAKKFTHRGQRAQRTGVKLIGKKLKKLLKRKAVWGKMILVIRLCFWSSGVKLKQGRRTKK